MKTKMYLERRMEILENKVKRCQKNVLKLCNKFYTQENYYEERKRRYTARAEKASKIYRKSLRNLIWFKTIMQKFIFKDIRTHHKMSGKKKYVLTLTHNQIGRLTEILNKDFRKKKNKRLII